MKFSDIVKRDAVTPGRFYRRKDGKFEWVIAFDPANAGRLVQLTDGSIAAKPVELYHHDFFDGDWRPSTHEGRKFMAVEMATTS